MAFTSPVNGGTAICAFSYATAPFGIDREMGGRIDTSYSENIFIGTRPLFSCDRNKDDAKLMVCETNLWLE